MFPMRKVRISRNLRAVLSAKQPDRSYNTKNFNKKILRTSYHELIDSRAAVLMASSNGTTFLVQEFKSLMDVGGSNVLLY